MAAVAERRAETAKNTFVLFLASASPVLAAAQIAQALALPLDKFHLLLIQLVALLALWDVRLLRNAGTVRRDRPPQVASDHRQILETAVNPRPEGLQEQDIETRTRRLTLIAPNARSGDQIDGSPEPVYEHDLYPSTLTYPLVGRFLSIVRPSLQGVLPSPYRYIVPNSTPLGWTVIHVASVAEPIPLRVEQSDNIAHLYKVTFELPHHPDVVFNFLGDSNNRQLWDTMCTGVRMLERVAPPETARSTTNKITVEWLSLKGIWPLKARDMVLLSHRIRLPGTAHDATGQLICATTSVDHPDALESTNFARLKLSLAGYICELAESGPLGEVRTRVEQITDLSAVGSFAPASLVRMITTKMVPQGISKMAQKLSEQQIATGSLPPELTLQALDIGKVSEKEPLSDSPQVQETKFVKPGEDRNSSGVAFPPKKEVQKNRSSGLKSYSSLWRSLLPSFFHNSQGTLGITIGSTLGAALVWWGLSKWTRYRR